ncbi:hypothetical protein MSAN_02294900 [Mycena sanguinolenta]|uniref:Uncharacterized protein n=1 Tax=Mycena sanguinolenta TaxID=230812 RepID=A0A8H6X9H8_9AGAR|nr:hypothetical protein MSAN_02294900 [Mycena sanguinolenta]
MDSNRLGQGPNKALWHRNGGQTSRTRGFRWTVHVAARHADNIRIFYSNPAGAAHNLDRGSFLHYDPALIWRQWEPGQPSDKQNHTCQPPPLDHGPHAACSKGPEEHHPAVARGSAAGDVRLRERLDPCLALQHQQDDAGAGDAGALSQRLSDGADAGQAFHRDRCVAAGPCRPCPAPAFEKGELSGRTAQTLNRILPLMTRLEDLELRSVAFWLEGGIGGACFGDLRTFRGLAIPPSCASLQAFLGRHGTITTLDVLGFREYESRLHLPQLTEYAGSASFMSHLDDATVRGIRSLDLRALGASLGAVLLRLGPSSNLRRVAGTLVDVEAAEVIEIVGEYASQIEHMVFRARKPVELPLAAVAERLGALPRLRQLSFWRYTYPSEAAGAADTWGAACKTLVRVVLDGADWRRVGGQWTVAAIQADDEQ